MLLLAEVVFCFACDMQRSGMQRSDMQRNLIFGMFPRIVQSANICVVIAGFVKGGWCCFPSSFGAARR